MRYVTDALLVAALIVGLALAWRTGRERATLRAQHQALVAEVAELPDADAALVRIQALPTGDPMDFTWRFHLPAGYPLDLRTGSGSCWSTNSDAIEGIGRVRFRPDDNGRLMVYKQFGGGSGLMSIGNPAFGRYIREHWHELRVEQIGANGATTLRPDEVALVLRLTLPDARVEELKRDHSDWVAWEIVPVVYELRLGKERPKP
jgi:hypothetical protein